MLHENHSVYLLKYDLTWIEIYATELTVTAKRRQRKAK